MTNQNFFLPNSFPIKLRYPSPPRPWVINRIILCRAIPRSTIGLAELCTFMPITKVNQLKQRFTTFLEVSCSVIAFKHVCSVYFLPSGAISFDKRICAVNVWNTKSWNPNLSEIQTLVSSDLRHSYVSENWTLGSDFRHFTKLFEILTVEPKQLLIVWNPY